MTATTKKLYEKVGIRLTDAQVIEMGEELAEERLEVNRLSEEKTAKTTEFKATEEYQAYKHETDTITEKIDALNTSIDELAKQIDDREKFVDVEVREEPDDGRNMVAIVRVDTGQIIKTRAMTLNEMAEATQRKRQPSLDFADHDGPEAHDTDPAPAPNGKVVPVTKPLFEHGGRKKKRTTTTDESADE